MDNDSKPTIENNEINITKTEATASELEHVRDLIKKAHPNAVPELVTGDTVDALIASVPAAEAAYQRIVDAERAAAPPPAPAVPHVPSGQPAAAVGSFVDIDALPTSELIRRGIEAKKKQ